MTEAWRKRVFEAIRRCWAVHHATFIWWACAGMVVIALCWLGYEFWRLLFYQGRMGAIDLRALWEVSQRYFAGFAVYKHMGSAVFPPASLLMLWPLIGWLPFDLVRWMWGLTALGALAWLSALVIRESGAETRQERWLVVLMLLAMYPPGATIGNGQLAVHLMPALFAGVLMLTRKSAGWGSDLLGAALVNLGLVKPTMSAPFFWLVLFVPGRIRPAALVVGMYITLTLLSMAFQGDTAPEIVSDAYRMARNSTSFGAPAGTLNIHTWFARAGLRQWNFPISLSILMALGYWTYRYRRADIWSLLSVVAFVARFWFYHRWYDDLLLLLPLVALFRLAKRGSREDGTDVVAGVLCGGFMLSLLAPGGLYVFPAPWNRVYTVLQMLLWCTVLVYFQMRIWREVGCK